MSILNNNRKPPSGHFNKHLSLDVNCVTIDSEFLASMYNLSPTAAFIKTDKNLSVGQEIAMIIRFPDNDDSIKATGEVVKSNYSGAKVEFKVFFNN
ncbi:MAG: PilZ domain-containing protein [Nitrospinales bacterium]